MYDPQVNDYVRWTTALGMVHEGWVYYKGKPDVTARRIKDKWVATSNYITIEIATKPRPQCDLSTFFHKRIHVCLCCFESIEKLRNFLCDRKYDISCDADLSCTFDYIKHIKWHFDIEE